MMNFKVLHLQTHLPKSHLRCSGTIMIHVFHYGDQLQFEMNWSGNIFYHLSNLTADVCSKYSETKPKQTTLFNAIFLYYCYFYKQYLFLK